MLTLSYITKIVSKLKTMKQLFVILTLLVTVTLNAQELTVEQHLEDFDIVVRQVEEL